MSDGKPHSSLLHHPPGEKIWILIEEKNNKYMENINIVICNKNKYRNL